VGTDVQIHLYADAENRETAFRGIVNEIVARGAAIAYANLDEGEPGPPVRFDGQTFLENIDALVGDLPASANRLFLDIGYRMLSGRVLNIRLNFRGDASNIDRPKTNSASIYARISLNDLSGALLLEKYVNLSEAIVADAMDVFFTLCGLESGNDFGFGHGVMTVAEDSCVLRSSMVYHRDASEFGLDFARVYARHKLGLYLCPLFSNRLDFWSLSRDEKDAMTDPYSPLSYPRQWADRERFASEPDSNAEAFEGFLSSITEERARLLSRLSIEDVKRRLAVVNDSIPEAVFHEFQGRGFVLATDPYTPLWRAYRYLGEQYGL
jgi:hypothetical protein